METMVSKSPKGQPKARNFYLVLNDLPQNMSATWNLNANSLEDALNTVWMLYDASLGKGEGEKVRMGQMKKIEENLDKNHTRVRLPSRKRPGTTMKQENPLFRAHYEKTRAEDMITYPWKNAPESPENGTTNVMFNLMHRGTADRRIRATRLEVRVQSKAHDGDTITTPAPKNAEDTPRTQLMTHKGSGELMIGIGNDRDRVRFRDAVKSVINRNL